MHDGAQTKNVYLNLTETVPILKLEVNQIGQNHFGKEFTNISIQVLRYTMMVTLIETSGLTVGILSAF